MDSREYDFYAQWAEELTSACTITMLEARL